MSSTLSLDNNYWSKRYQTQQTGWDIGSISPPLKAYFAQLTNKNLKILIPGAGNAYEAEYLHNNGFNNVFVVDISEEPIKNFQERCPSFKREHLIIGDFFELDLTFDLIIEQTFFCALDPSLRNAYAVKMKELLKPNGKVVGVLFDDPLFKDHPPFGGNKQEYLTYFESVFKEVALERCYNSLPPRANRELFMTLLK